MPQGGQDPDGWYARQVLGRSVNPLLAHFEYTTITLADGEAAALSDDVVLGVAHIFDRDNDALAVADLLGGANSVSLDRSAGSTTFAAAANGTDGQVNVYWDAGAGQYELNNETGGEVTFEVLIVRGP